MKKEIVTEIIFSKSGGRRPIKCEEFIHLLKPEYIIDAGFDEPEEFSDSGHDGGYYIHVYLEREETPEETEVRLLERKKELESQMERVMVRAKTGDIFLYKMFKNLKLHLIETLILKSYGYESRTAIFERHYKGSNMFLNITISDMVGYKWEVSPEDKRKSIITKVGIK